MKEYLNNGEVMKHWEEMFMKLEKDIMMEEDYYEKNNDSRSNLYANSFNKSS